MAELRISDDPADIDLDVVHGFLSQHAYWCQGIPRELLARALANSLCFSAWLGGAQVGFARIVGDRATFGYLADVFVLPAHRGHGIAKALVGAAMAHPEIAPAACRHRRRTCPARCRWICRSPSVCAAEACADWARLWVRPLRDNITALPGGRMDAS